MNLRITIVIFVFLSLFFIIPPASAATCIPLVEGLPLIQAESSGINRPAIMIAILYGESSFGCKAGSSAGSSSTRKQTCVAYCDTPACAKGCAKCSDKIARKAWCADEQTAFEKICNEGTFKSAPQCSLTTSLTADDYGMGPAQFQPTTWTDYRLYPKLKNKNPWNPDEAVFALATKLIGDGVNLTPELALTTYNGDWKVLEYAKDKLMKAKKWEDLFNHVISIYQKDCGIKPQDKFTCALPHLIKLSKDCGSNDVCLDTKIKQEERRILSLPTSLLQLTSDGKTSISTGKTTNNQTIIFKAKLTNPDNKKVKLQIELRRIDEYAGMFDETRGGLKESAFVQSGAVAETIADGLINGNYHWRARAIDEKGNPSDWVEFGNNSFSDIDFTVNLVSSNPLPLTIITPQQLATTIINKAYLSQLFKATGGREPYTWSLYKESSPLPPGLSLNRDGRISGTPITAGTYNFVVQVEDGANWWKLGLGQGNISTKVFSLAVEPREEIAPTPTQSPEKESEEKQVIPSLKEKEQAKEEPKPTPQPPASKVNDKKCKITINLSGISFEMKEGNEQNQRPTGFAKSHFSAGSIKKNDIGQYHIEFTFTNEGKRLFSEITDRISRSGGLLSLYINNNLISSPVVRTKIVSDTLLVGGEPYAKIEQIVGKQNINNPCPADISYQEQTSSPCPKTAIHYPKERTEYFSSSDGVSYFMPLILSAGDSTSYGLNLYKRGAGTLVSSDTVPRCQERISSESLVIKDLGDYTLIIFGSEGGGQSCVSENDLSKFLKNPACAKDYAVVNFKVRTATITIETQPTPQSLYKVTAYMVGKNNEPLSNIKFNIGKMLENGYYSEADINGKIEVESLSPGKYCLMIFQAAEPGFSSGYAAFSDFQIINSDVNLGKIIYDISLLQGGGCHY